MERIMKKQDLIDELATRTGFFKKNMTDVVNALSDIIIENFKTAKVGKNSELHIAPGVVLIGTRKPACEAKNPKTGEIVISPEKVIPSATFKQSIRLKLYKQSKGYHKRNKKG